MMIKKYRSPGRIAWGGDRVEERTFERETDKCLFDSRGNRTLKVSDWCIYHDTREQAQAHLDLLNAQRQRQESSERIRKAAPALLEALELIMSKQGQVLNMNMTDEDIALIDAAIAAAKGE